MTRTVLIFGLIAGVILAAMLVITLTLHEHIGFDRGELIGYTSMVMAFLLVFFGIRSHRETLAGGSIGFRRAFLVGSLIVVVASLCYVVTWQVLYTRYAPDFMADYQTHIIDKARAAGASDASIAKTRSELEGFAEMYRDPFVRAAISFVEPLPVGLVIALVSAGILSRRRRERAEPTAVAAGGTRH